MPKINSKAKGAAGERELARKLKEYGYDCRRGQQYCGANGDADVVMSQSLGTFPIRESLTQPPTTNASYPLT